MKTARITTTGKVPVIKEGKLVGFKIVDPRAFKKYVAEQLRMVKEDHVGTNH